MNPSLAFFFSEIMAQYHRLFGRPHHLPDTEDVRSFRMEMATLVGTICSLDDKITDNDSTRQAILEVAAGCFRMLEIIGDHPVDRIARELDVDRQYVNKIALLAATHRMNPKELVVFVQGKDGISGKIKDRILHIFKEETKEKL